MDNSQTITALLTGRGNNSLKDKNILDILGHPVLFYPAKAAKDCPLITNWYCSSDDDRILNAASEVGYLPIRRPLELAAPNSQHVDCILHAVNFMKDEAHFTPDILVVLLANNVTITTEWITECINIMKNDEDVSAVVPTYSDNDHHPYRAKKLSADGFISSFIELADKNVSTNRQELPECVFLAHNFWVLNVKKLLAGEKGSPPWSFMGEKVMHYAIDESIDIHDTVDLIVAREWVKKFIKTD